VCHVAPARSPGGLTTGAGLLLVSLAAFVLLGPASQQAALGGWAGSFLNTVLAVVFVSGIEGLFFAMLPLTFMHGNVVYRWSKVGWALAFGTGVFLWWQLLLNRDHAYAESLRQTNVQLVIFTLVFFMGTTGVVWAYFRLFGNTAKEGGEAEELAEI